MVVLIAQQFSLVEAVTIQTLSETTLLLHSIAITRRAQFQIAAILVELLLSLAVTQVRWLSFYSALCHHPMAKFNANQPQIDFLLNNTLN